MPFNVARQFTFALASTLTALAKEAQGEVIRSIERTFTVRNTWDKPSNAMGIKVLPATKADLSAAVVTRADWLTGHEEGEDKVPARAGGNLAIPTGNVRRNKRDIIRRGQRPNALRGKRSFVLKTRSGPVLYQRQGRGKNSRLVALYRLRPRARLKRRSTVVEPTVRVFEKRFDALFYLNLKKALATAK